MTYKAKAKFCIGISAWLDGSVHSSTFKRAIGMAMEDHPHYDPELIWVDDRASPEGGFAAATELRNRRVALVVGHYSSAAARGALPVYREGGIPLLLPAATADNLTRDFSNAFRLCSSDTQLARYIYRHLSLRHRSGRIAILDDGSVHGRCLSGTIRAYFGGTDHQLIRSDTTAILFAGSYANSIQFVKQWRNEGHSLPIYLTDDVVHPDLVKDLGERSKEVCLFGYAAAGSYPFAQTVTDRYHALYGGYPQTYFPETYAAMQIALACSADRGFGRTRIQRLSTGKWETVLGETSFVDQECREGPFSLWIASAERGLYALQ